MDIRIRAATPEEVLAEVVKFYNHQAAALNARAEQQVKKRDELDLLAQARYARFQAEWWADVEIVPPEVAT